MLRLSKLASSSTVTLSTFCMANFNSGGGASLSTWCHRHRTYIAALDCRKTPIVQMAVPIPFVRATVRGSSS
ncbi:hypothetical protein PF005_g5522 [Phytophthora fragariae]|uniref:Uncharacterized protein n=1 Tax=Phytophthora fragariae TaxID=53985 RepID=A0A6A3ZZG2_9STRA|nr:hypothetical protein PF003_g21659 [Phytophthora fragariae]KAE8943941.1 hypothetical protein PF009_g6349 [Phytophthora fragariae]KAE9021288.1 hypothetical protein PF011_g5005 [Phytophthora fragariae]KAE9126455.1 hypothetical protein PF010_g5265 [Phytophthora fragariae]KAE9134179.1 hypothetical protein PF007_g3052 [Phytophthora fragariae]